MPFSRVLGALHTFSYLITTVSYDGGIAFFFTDEEIAQGHTTTAGATS